MSERIQTHGLVQTKFLANYIIKVVRDNQTYKKVLVVNYRHKLLTQNRRKFRVRHIINARAAASARGENAY